MRITIIIAFLFGLLGVALFAFQERLEKLTGIIFCVPDSKLGAIALMTSGADLGIIHRAKWLEMPYGANRTFPPATARRICTAEETRGDCDFRSFHKAMSRAKDGDVFVMTPGTYEEGAIIYANSVKLLAEPGAYIRGRAVKGKAALVIKGNDTTIEGLECSDISVSDRNGACIRANGHNLTLRGVHFHDSEQGVLAGIDPGRVIIEYSVFERLGNDGRSHGVYMGAGPDSQLIFRHSLLVGTKNEGHGIKSRAASTVIKNSLIAALGGNNSRAIDLPNGGLNLIQNSILQNGPNSTNMDLIGIGLELDVPPADRNQQRTQIDGNVILLERYLNKIIHVEQVPSPVQFNNKIVCGNRTDADASIF